MEEAATTKKYIQYTVLWLTGGILYFYCEIAFRGYSHYSMLICGGFCFVTAGLVGLRIRKSEINRLAAPLIIAICGALIISAFELLTGIIVNLYFGMGVWDYRELPYNLWGQICLPYSLLWGVLTFPCMWITGLISRRVFN